MAESNSTTKIFNEEMKEPALLEYFHALAGIKLDDEGDLISGKSDVKRVVKAGRRVRRSLSAAVAGIGLVMVHGSQDAGLLDIYGYMTHEIGQIIENTYLIEKALNACLKGSSWPVQEICDHYIDMKQLLWSLPFAAFKGEETTILQQGVIGNAAENYLCTSTVNLKYYTREMDIAIGSREIDRHIRTALRVASEFTSILPYLDDLKEMSKYYKISAIAA